MPFPPSGGNTIQVEKWSTQKSRDMIFGRLSSIHETAVFFQQQAPAKLQRSRGSGPRLHGCYGSWETRTALRMILSSPPRIRDDAAFSKFQIYLH